MVKVPPLPCETFTLDNGLRVRLIPLDHLQSATVSFFVRVGSRYEDAEDNGLSHFLEHMLYRGTRSHPVAHELNLAIERLGGTLDAATHVDFTSYDLAVPKESLSEGIGLLAEVLREPQLTDVTVEKQIIREEILEDLNEDGEQIDIDNVSRRLLYPGHPLGFSIPGPIDNVDRFGTQELRKHHTTYYTARNGVLCVAGAFDSARVGAAIRRSFESLPEGRAIDPAPVSTTTAPERFAYVRDPGSQTDLRVSFHTPGVRSREAPALLLLARILDDGLSTRVHQMICEERGLAYDAFASNDSLEDCGVFDFGATVEHKKATQLVETVLELVTALRAQAPTEEELGKAKRRFLWDLRAVRDDPNDAVHFVGSSALFGLPEELETMAERVTNVVANDIRTVVRRYFRPEDAYFTCVGALDGSLLQDLRSIAIG